jgi:phage baseplate assembly protein W
MAEFTIKDIDFDFEPHPVTGDILLKTDVKALNQNLKTILLTELYEKPFRTDVPVGINQFLFENDDGFVVNYLVERIHKKINQFEPRATNLLVNVGRTEANGFSIDISYTFNNKSNESFTINLERNR